MTTTTIVLRPPTLGLFAGVEVRAGSQDGPAIGAAPAFTYDRDTDTMSPLTEVPVECYEHDATVLHAGWLHENSKLGVLWTEHPVGNARAKRVGGR